jgi:hypothetical protein
MLYNNDLLVLLITSVGRQTPSRKVGGEKVIRIP